MINRELRLFRALKRKYKPLLKDANKNMNLPARGIFKNAIAIFFSMGYRAGLQDGRTDHKEPHLKLRPWKPNTSQTTPVPGRTE